MYLLNADTLTHLYQGHEKVVERLRQCDDPDIGVSIVTKVEVLRGRYEFLLKAGDVSQLAGSTNTAPADRSAARRDAHRCRRQASGSRV